MTFMYGMMARAGLVAVASGSEQVLFEGFFRDHYARLARALYLLTDDTVEAEDLAQEALLRAYERWGRISRMESPEGYVYRTALNLQRSRLRHLAVRARRGIRPAQPPDPMAGVETRDELDRILRSLPAGQREALVLVEWLGMTAEEASGILGVAASSVRARLSRARAAVRTTMGVDDE